MNLYERFHQTARTQTDHPAILGPRPDDFLSYGDLDAAIGAGARGLQEAAVRPGACLGLHCPSGATYIIFSYAAWRCGAAIVPVPVELAPPEQEDILRTVRMDFVISSERAPAFLEPFRRGGGVELASGVASVPRVTVVPVSGRREHPPDFHTINTAFVRFTSGTTAAAKGVVLSHESIYERIHAANEALCLTPEDRVVWPLSMAYHFAVSIVAYLNFGASIILLPNHFAEAILSASRRHRATVIYASPAHYAWLAAGPPTPLPNLRLAISTTAALGHPIAEEFLSRFGVPVSQALGIIEVGLPFINRDFARDRPGAVGRVLPAYRLRLEDIGFGEGLGEVLLAGKGFLDAYYDPWRLRAAVMPDGWFRSGDVGQLDADGCLCLRGRIKDLINVLGMKFFPQEVEAVLAAHPDVESACVFARPDPRLGEIPVAQVVPRPGLTAPASERELLRHCQRYLAGFKVPQHIEFVETLARTASGKVLHRDTRRAAEVAHAGH
jgi:long-chain acyl-CoA synthetase